MNVEDLIDELASIPEDQRDYELRVNMGDETTGDMLIRVDSLRWDHEDRIVEVVVEGSE